MQILVLEDNRPMRLALQDCLQDAGHQVVSAATTDEADALLNLFKFDLLIFDLLIGAEVSLPIIRMAEHVAPDADVIVVTGSHLYPAGELMSEFPNVSWTLRKPFPLGDVVSLAAFSERRGLKRSDTKPLQ